MKKYTSFQVAKAINEKYPRLRGWIDVGAVKPSEPADGIGSKAYFYREDIYLIGLFRECLALGFSRDEAASAVSDVKSYLKAAPKAHVEHVLFAKRNDSFFNVIEQKKVKPKRGTLKEALSADLPVRTILLDDEMFKKRSLYRLISVDGRLSGANDYTALVVINYKQIIQDIDQRLE